MAQAVVQLILALIFSSLALAQTSEAPFAYSPPPESKYVFVGHNVTQTARVYPTRRCSLGTTIAACGTTDKLTLGVSPWLLRTYNMYNLNARYELRKEGEKTYAVQAGYFRTYDRGWTSGVGPAVTSQDTREAICRGTEYLCYTGYEMSSLWTYLIQTERLAPNFWLHINLQLAYYWNDKKPFSLRRPQAWKQPWQVNFTTLMEMHMAGPFYGTIECGGLGLDGKYPALHAGMGIQRRGLSWAWQIGATATGSLQAWQNMTGRYDVQSQAVYNSEVGFDRAFSDSELDKDYSVHPEIFVQYAFQL